MTTKNRIEMGNILAVLILIAIYLAGVVSGALFL